MGTVLSLFASGHSLATSISRKSLTTMSQERVKSKNLFNFRPQGFIDPDVVFYDEKMKKEMGMDPVAMEEQMLSHPIIPMLDDYEFTCKLSMTAEESESALMMQKIWQAIAGPDFESMRTNPLLFPGKASPELMAKMPPTIVWEDEFDMYITPATRFAHKLRTAGRLLEFVCIPGAKHGSGMMPSFRALWKLAREAWRVAVQEYLVKN